MWKDESSHWGNLESLTGHGAWYFHSSVSPQCCYWWHLKCPEPMSQPFSGNSIMEPPRHQVPSSPSLLGKHTVARGLTSAHLIEELFVWAFRLSRRPPKEAINFHLSSFYFSWLRAVCSVHSRYSCHECGASENIQMCPS